MKDFKDLCTIFKKKTYAENVRRQKNLSGYVKIIHDDLPGFIEIL